MKYKLLRFSLLSMLVMFFGGLAYADQVTMKYSGDATTNMTGENDAALLGLDADAWSVVGDKGANSNMPGLNKAGDFRLYWSATGGNTITVQSLAQETINSIAITFTGATYGNVSVTVDGNAVTGTDGVYDINSTSFVLGNANTSNTQVRISEIVITYGEAGQVDNRLATTLTLGEHQTTGVVNESMDFPTVTVTDADGTSVQYDNIDWTSSDETVASVNDGNIGFLKVGTTTITAKFVGNNQYKPSSASFTLTVTEAPYTSIAAMLADITSTRTTVTYQFENLLVTYVNGSNTFVSDGQNGFLFYGSNLGLNAGEIITGSVTGQLYTYNGLPEMSLSANGISAQVVSEGNLVAWPTIAAADLQNYINIPVTIENAVFVEAGSGKNLTFKVGEETLSVYNNWSIDVEALEADKTYTLTGVGSVYSQNETTTYQLYLVSFEEKTAEEGYVYRDFAVQLTNADIFATDVNKFGVKVAEDGTYTATAFDDETANFTVNAARFNDASHGWVNCEFTIPVQGPVKVGLGNCLYGTQDGTITDAEGNVTALTVGKDNCWHNNKEANISYTIYKGLAPTTLTIKHNGYCPFISVEAVDPADLKSDATVAFASGEAEGTVPAAVTQEVGKTITLPTNFTLYVEGKTLTAWTDGTNEYAPGTEYTVPENDVTLTAVFTPNSVNLSNRTEPVTLKFNFRRDQGAPTVAYQNATGVWVAQATIGNSIIDVKADFDTNNGGKFANGNWNDWAQLNGGTTFTIPSCKGAVVSMEAYSDITTTTIDGQSDYTQGKTISYTIGGSAETVDVVIGDGSYYRYIQVVLPVVESQGGQTFDNEVATVVWPFNDPANIAAYTATPANVFSMVAANTGDLTITGTGTGQAKYPDGSTVTFAKLKPAGSSNSVEWVVKPAAGLTFTPTKISAYIARFGTDAENGITITAKAGDGETITLGNFTAPRNNKTQAEDKYGSSSNYTNQFVIELTAEQQAQLASAEGLSVFGTVGVGSSKEGGYAEMTIEGLVNGTMADVAKYTLTAVASPEEAGSVSIYPAADEYEEGSEVTLTATKNFGYKFVNWTDATGAEVSTEAKFTYTVNADAELTANFESVNTYELALTVDGTNSYMVSVDPAPTVVDGKNMYEEGTAVQLTANQYEGLVTFNNWSDGETGSSKLIMVNEDIQLTATYSQADIIAGWDFYQPGNNGRVADFYAQDNEATALSLVKTATGETAGWLDKSTVSAGGYESFLGAAVNWCTGASNGDVGNYHWQTKLNAEAFTDIYVQFQMLYNYNAYQRYNVEYSIDGEEWLNVGSITMSGAKAPASFKGQLPEAANNQAQLYVRMIADKTSTVDGTASANDGNTLAMFFITGTPKLVNDGTAPVLVSTVPVSGATNASATGKIVLTFDEKVKAVEGAKATLGTLELTPNISGKTATFEYKGLEYSTEYTFTLPANSISDLTDNVLAQPITLVFTTMTRPSVNKGSYDVVVENVDQLVAAIQAANSRADKNTRFRIFLKNGTYVLPLSTTETISSDDGNAYPSPITMITGANISFIGESREGTIITNDLANAKTYAGTYGTTSVYDGIGKSDVLQLASSASGTYFQDLTVKSGLNDALGRNLAIQDKATNTIYKNTCLWGYQDTWTSNNDYGYYYFEGGVVRGRTDFLCGKGDAFFNAVDIQVCMNTGGYIAVPSKSIKYGYVFKGCTIKGESNELNGKYTLGRPWGSGTPVALYIDTKMEILPSAVGWSEMSNGWPKRFAEYNSMTATGAQVDLSGRKPIFGGSHENNPVLTAEEALEAGDLHNMYGEWDPTLATEQAPIPANVKIAGNILSWEGSNYALNWAVCLNGNVVAFTTEPTFDISTIVGAESRSLDAEATAWTVRAANEMGGLSEASAVASITTGIETIAQPVRVDSNVYNLQGIRVQNASKGLYIINGKKVVK